MTPSSWLITALAGISVFYVAIRVSAWIGRTVGPWFLVALGFVTLVGTVAYLVVGELRERREQEAWRAKCWWIEREARW